MLGPRRGQFRQSALAVCAVRSSATPAGPRDPRVQTSSAGRRQSLREHDPARGLDEGKVGERLWEVAEVVSVSTSNSSAYSPSGEATLTSFSSGLASAASRR